MVLWQFLQPCRCFGHLSVGYLRLRVPEAFPPGTCPRLEALAERCEALEVFRAAAIGANEQMPSKGQ